ncbi:NAD(P)/FAD-dependent oxidoreductase [Longivirga aurantiaca]|uniref:NAD(P)/FAD-dependent oxidoreductase n=1 Tax=Longivirga aurantiaca TaxID=1837743 RepID=A0ABW1SWT2_9ACTN
MMRSICIVGASLAGLRGAEEIRRQGFEGRMTLIGAEAQFPPFDRPPLSKAVLASTWTLEQARLPVFEDLDAAIHLGVAATDLDLAARCVRVQGGTSVPFDGLMIATGTEVIRLRCPGADLPGVRYLRSADDASLLLARISRRPRVAVIGAGFIGSEIASVCRERGLEVTLIDSSPLPLEPQVGRLVASYIFQQHRDRGVATRFGASVTSIEGDSDVTGVTLSGGDTIAADLVVVGIGVRPAVGWLSGSGLDISDGVLCDEECRAIGADGVVAAGDVARWQNPAYGRAMRIEHWTNAVEQSEYAARSLLGVQEGPFRSIPYFWSDQFTMHLQCAGVRGDTDEVVEGSMATGAFVIESRVDDRVVGVLASNSVNRFQKARRALAAARAHS